MATANWPEENGGSPSLTGARSAPRKAVGPDPSATGQGGVRLVVDTVSRIVAAGVSAAPSGLPLRMSCQAAMPLGARAADTVQPDRG